MTFRHFPVIGLAVLLGAQIGCQSQRPLEDVYSDGIEAYDEGNYVTAELDFSEYTDRHPSDHKGQYQLGRTLLELGEPAQASEHLWIAYDLRPNEEGYLDTLARALFEADRIDDLYRVLTSRTADPGLASDYLRLGRYAARLGDADQAKPALITAVQIDDGSSTEPLLALAEFFRSVGDEPNEQRALTRAYHLDPFDENTNTRLRQLGVTPGPTLTVETDADW